MKSLEARLASGLLLALLVVFTLLLWGASVAVESLGRSYVQTRLEHDAEALLGAVRRAPDGSARLRAGRVTPIYQQPLSGHYFEIAFSDGTRLRSRSLWDYDLVLPSVALGAVRRDQPMTPRVSRTACAAHSDAMITGQTPGRRRRLPTNRRVRDAPRQSHASREF